MFYKKGAIMIIVSSWCHHGTVLKVSLIVSSIKKNPSSDLCGAAIKAVVDFKMFMQEILDNAKYTKIMIA